MFSEVAEIALVAARLGQSQQLPKTRVILILNFSRAPCNYLYEIEVNVLPLFTEIEKSNCFSVYALGDLNNIFRRKALKIDSETLAKQRGYTRHFVFVWLTHYIHSVEGE